LCAQHHEVNKIELSPAEAQAYPAEQHIVHIYYSYCI